MSLFERLRALGWVFLSILYFLLAERIAARAASGFTLGVWEEPIFRGMLLFLLVVGFAAMGYVGQRQRNPIRAMGLGMRPGWGREFWLGVAVGWAGIIACVLPIAIFGGLYLSWSGSLDHWGLLVLDVITLAVAALAEEVAFRGYPFQRLIEATGPVTATLLASLAFGALHIHNPGATAGSTVTTVLAGWLMALAYLRTRALWVGWGFHFGWNAAMGLLFGLPVSGLTIFSPVIHTNSYGPLWLTGGSYGPEGSAVGIVVLFVLLFVMASVTRGLKYQYAIPEIVPGGIPVDIDAAARRQHEAAMATPAEPAKPTLVQIVPASTVVPERLPHTAPDNTWGAVEGTAEDEPKRSE